MNRALRLGLALLVGAHAVRAADDAFLDRLGDALRFRSADGVFATRLSGLFDLEAYRFDNAAPGFVATDDRALLNPRLTLFLDAEAGPQWYGFAQVRWDRGFDPGAHRGRVRLDEYAVRFTPRGVPHLAFQAGKFATVVGNWTARHDAWRDAFITAPLPYSGATPVWDTVALRNSATLFGWAYLDRAATPADRAADKGRRLPVVWGTAYAPGAAVSARAGKFEAAVELKSTALSARPAAWREYGPLWNQPAVNARLGFRPGPDWNFGLSAGDGPYLYEATATVPAGLSAGDYRQKLFAADAAWARHHWQAWAEIFAARFTVPGVGDAAVRSGYVEARYKFTPQLSAGLRVNRQEFGTLPAGAGGARRWGHDRWRAEFAPAWRWTPHVQLKLQFTAQREDDAAHRLAHDTAAQLTVRF